MDPAIPAADEKAILSQKRKRTLNGQECRVCGDQSTGKHYGVYSCDGCSGFFKRTSRRTEPWVCKNGSKCDVDKNSRNECKSCRLHKCLGVGMSMEGVFRRPRLVNATGSFTENFSNSSMNTQNVDEKDHYNRQINQDNESQGDTLENVAVHKPLSALNTPLNTNTTVIKSEAIDNPDIHVHSVESRDLNPTNKLSITSLAMETVASLQKLANSHCQTPLSSADTHNGRRTLLVNASSRDPQPENIAIASSVSSQRSRVITTTHAQSQNPKLNGTSHQQTKATSKMCSVHELLKAVEPVHFNSSENIQDAAMRLMTASIRFARNLPCFTRIPFRDQIILLEESWKKLFLLDAAYWALPLETGSFSVANDITRRQSSPEIRTVQELLTHLRSFRGDLTELACLKAVLIFRPETKGLKDAETVDKIQDEIQLLLSSHVTSTHPNQPARFGKLLLSLLAVQSIAEKPIEEVLFKLADDKDIFETLLSKLIDS